MEFHPTPPTPKKKGGGHLVSGYMPEISIWDPYFGGKRQAQSSTFLKSLLFRPPFL